MGLSYEQEIERREDEHVKYLAEHVCNKDGDKPYVFISYKSDDWKIVLHDVVYRLVKEYGLNVYFDGDFSGHNPHWTTQFPENMAHPNCRGVLAFIDDLYSTSYATLLELMYSQCSCQDEDNNYEYVRKNVVPVNLVKALAVIKDTADTGLGKTQYFDGERDVKNVKAADEKKLFDEAFERGCELKILKKTKNPYKGELSKKLCSVMVEEVLAPEDNLRPAHQRPEQDIPVFAPRHCQSGRNDGELLRETDLYPEREAGVRTVPNRRGISRGPLPEERLFDAGRKQEVPL